MKTIKTHNLRSDDSYGMLARAGAIGDIHAATMEHPNETTARIRHEMLILRRLGYNPHTDTEGHVGFVSAQKADEILLKK
jgi:hypothetical protein